MKDFSVDGIVARTLIRASQNSYFSGMSPDSEIMFLINALASTEAELIRYGEYLLKESKWDYSENLSSVLSQIKFLGYNPPRQVSSVGVVLITADPLIKQLGTYNVNKQKIITSSDLANFPGGVTSSITIPVGYQLYSSDGTIPFVTTANATLTSGNGSGEGFQYVTVPVVQGLIKSVTQQMVGNTPFEELIILNPNVEEASSTGSSNQFFNVSVSSTYFDPVSNQNTTTSVTWTQVDDLREATYTDKVFQIITDEENLQSFIIRFGSGVTGQLLPVSATVTVTYLETMGASGNLSESYTLTNIPPFSVSSGTSIPLYCSNPDPILGGQAMNDVSTIKAIAPTYALTVNSIGTELSYEKAISNIPGFSLVKVFPGSLTQANGSTVPVINFSVIASNGGLPSSSDVLTTVNNAISDLKSPTDSLVYVPANLVGIHFNVKAFTNSTAVPLLTLQSEIQTALFNQYQINNLSFQQPLYSKDLAILLNGITGLYNQNSYVEALITLNNPTGELSGNGLLIPFQFDSSFTASFGQFNNFNDGVYHIIKVQLICGVETGASRTLFLTMESIDGVAPPQQVLRMFKPITSRITDPAFMSTLLKAYPFAGITNSSLNNTQLIAQLGGIAPAETLPISTPPLAIEAFNDLQVIFNPMTGAGSVYISSSYNTALGNSLLSSQINNLQIKIYAEPYTQDLTPVNPLDIYSYNQEDNVVEVING